MLDYDSIQIPTSIRKVSKSLTGSRWKESRSPNLPYKRYSIADSASVKAGRDASTVATSAAGPASTAYWLVATANRLANSIMSKNAATDQIPGQFCRNSDLLERKASGESPKTIIQIMIIMNAG